MLERRCAFGNLPKGQLAVTIGNVILIHRVAVDQDHVADGNGELAFGQVTERTSTFQHRQAAVAEPRVRLEQLAAATIGAGSDGRAAPSDGPHDVSPGDVEYPGG